MRCVTFLSCSASAEKKTVSWSTLNPFGMLDYSQFMVNWLARSLLDRISAFHVEGSEFESRPRLMGQGWTFFTRNRRLCVYLLSWVTSVVQNCVFNLIKVFGFAWPFKVVGSSKPTPTHRVTLLSLVWFCFCCCCCFVMFVYTRRRLMCVGGFFSRWMPGTVT